MVRLVANTKKPDVQAAYLSLCFHRKDIDPTELSLLREVLADGSPEEQFDAVNGVALICCRAIRRVLIDVLNDSAAPLEVRQRATEMLHLHASRETAEACVKALGDRDPGIRFWAAYTLGAIATRKGLREIAASALERVLDDGAVAPGWWSVGREAQAIIVGLRDDPGENERLQVEIRRIEQDSNASAEDRRWAECYKQPELLAGTGQP